MSAQAVLWAAFGAIAMGMIAVDLGVASRAARAPSTRAAARFLLIWVLLAFLFGVGVWYGRGPEHGRTFFTAYLLEQALDVDNLFIFLLIFKSLDISPQHEPRILKWGILSALVMRGVFILAGVALLSAFRWALYALGGFVLWTGTRMLLPEPEASPRRGWLAAVARKFLPAADAGADGAFVVRRTGGWGATRLLLALLLVEAADLIFAVDSIPAVLAVTTDPLVVYTSNVLAILSLRALYFLLTAVVELFRYLNVGLGVVLIFVGIKMILRGVYDIPAGITLGVVASVLLASVAASVILPRDGRAAR